MNDNTTPEILWPVHLKPQRDELLSSWIVRLAMSHGQKLHTFCSLTWPGKAIWNRDIDRCAGKELLQVLETKTGTSIKRVWATTLGAYEGRLYEKHTVLGPNPWILSTGVYHRTRKRFGLQYCSSCLAEDREPYYRREWRLAFNVFCEKHQLLLRDRCPSCGAAVNFHRDELGNHKKHGATSLTLCHICGIDLRHIDQNISRLTHPSGEPAKSSASPAEITFSHELLRTLERGYAQITEGTKVYSMLYFAGLRQIMKILAMREKRVDKLRLYMSDLCNVEPYHPESASRNPDIQELDIIARRQLIGLARCLLDEWPSRFIELSQRHKLWSSIWLRHLEPTGRECPRPIPYWFWTVVHEHLYRARYCPSDIEIRAALQHLKTRDKLVNNSELSRLLGISIVRRKGVFNVE